MPRQRHIFVLFIFSTTLWCIAFSTQARAAGQSGASTQIASQAAIEKGRVAVTQVCTGCHAGGGGIMRMVEVRERSQDDWRETVYRMIGRGAQVFPDEIEPLALYLASAGRRSRTETTTSPATGAASSEAVAILERRCQRCHDIAKATTPPGSGDWTTVLDRMVSLGATVTAAERQTLTAYLSGLKR